MAFFNFLWYIISVAVLNIFEQVLNAADWIMSTIEDYEIFENLVKFLSSCVSSYYFWQALATIGFCLHLRRLADRFPPPPIVPINVGLVDVGPSMEQLLEDKEKSLKVAASMNDDLGTENAGLRTKVDYLQKELDLIAKDRYALVHEKLTLQNRLGDFNSWPEFRVEYEELVTQYEAMKMQRAREHIAQEQIMYIAQEAKVELAAAKRAEAMSKVAHSEELKVVKQERDEAREKYQTLLTATTTTPAIATTAIATITAAGQDTPGDKVLLEENTRLTLALHSKTSLLSKKTSELERMRCLVKTRSDHSASQLQSAASTILNLKGEKAKSEERIAELERDVRAANEKAEQMEDMYTAVAFAEEEDKEEKNEKEEEDEKEEERSRENIAETSWLLKQVVAMSKKGRKDAGGCATVGGSGADEDESEEEDEDDEEGGDSEDREDEEDKEEDEEEEQEQKVHDENEDLFNDMMGLS